jgi:hypothetical protein
MCNPATQDRLVILGCRVHQMVAAMALVATTRVLLVVMVLWAGIVGVVSPPLVRSYGGDDIACLQKPGVVEPSMEELYMDQVKN